MANPLSQIVGGQKLDTETLPYTGETFTPGGKMKTNKWGQTMAEANDPAKFKGTVWKGAKSEEPEDIYAKYRDPKTGEVMSPEEYALYLGNKVPKQIPGYAGDAVTNPNQSASELTSSATRLNNSRNDIATGTTDPYKVGNKSGIAYSPEQLKAIESAYAGIYDPALEDVFTRLREKKTEDDRIEARAASREATTFSTDEAIRRYNATNGANKGTSGTKSIGLLRGEDGYVNWEQYQEKAKEAEKEGQSMKDFVKDYPPTNYINPDDQEKLPSYLQPNTDMMSSAEVTSYIWTQLSSPEAAAWDDTLKANWIKSLGKDPTIFMPNYFE